MTLRATFIALGFLILTVVDSDAATVNLSGRWTATGYSCGPIAPTETVDVFDDGDDFQGIKVTGDKCVTAGAVTFFGSRSGVKACKMVTGSEVAPNSGTIDCPKPLTVLGPNSFTLGGISFKRSSTITVGGTAARLAVSGASCRNATAGTRVTATLAGPSGWTCKGLKVKAGDTVVLTVTGKVR